MDEKRLPNLQIFLAVLFSAAALFAPLLTPRLGLLVGILLGLGLLLGLATLAVGWRIVVQERPARYPFHDWSLRLLRPFLKDGRAGLPRAQGGASPRLLGWLNLALGALITLAVVAGALSLLL